MLRSSSKLPSKVSLSLASLLPTRPKVRRPTAATRAIGFAGQDPVRVQYEDLVSILVEASDVDHVLSSLGRTNAAETISPLATGYLSARASLSTVNQLLDQEQVLRIQSKKRSKLHLSGALQDAKVLQGTPATRQVAETGQGVLVGIVDSGFDLSHPMFRDQAGKLRVEALLVQELDQADREFDNAQLEDAWADGAGPGADQHGHGTHVASIAGGSPWNGLEGVAPEARFLLVQTDFLNTDMAVRWIFDKASGRPCVVNMSLGHHFGAHDGTDVEERFHETITGSGKILVIAAGNERNDSIHVGGRFFPTQVETVPFDIFPQLGGEPPFAVITLWHDQGDEFDVTLVTPNGQLLEAPSIGRQVRFQSSLMDVTIARGEYTPSRLIQTQIAIEFQTAAVPFSLLRDWGLRLGCVSSVIGRIDGWFNNSGFAAFRAHPLVEEARTVGLAATGRGCVAVASHVSRNAWDSDLGAQSDIKAVLERSSPFSSLGPTRDGRSKPDISAPGQYVTAALAKGSSLADRDERALSHQRLLTIEGTSMAAPVVTGLVALMLQKKPNLTADRARQILTASVRLDGHTGPAGWNPVYGFGKLDAVSALQRT